MVTLLLGHPVLYLVTLNLKFDLLLKHFNLGHNFLTKSDGAFILHMFFSLWQDLYDGAVMFYLMTLKFDLLLKNFILGHNFLTRSDRAFILHTCIPCFKTISHGTITFDLDLEVWPCFENIYLFGCYLVMVAVWWASLSSCNSYWRWCLDGVLSALLGDSDTRCNWCGPVPCVGYFKLSLINTGKDSSLGERHWIWSLYEGSNQSLV